MAITAQSAYNLIYKKNYTCTVQEYAYSIADPDTGTRTDGSVTNHTVYLTPPYRKERYSNGDAVPDGLEVVYFSPYGLTFTPELGQKLTKDSDVWVFEDIRTIGNIAGATVLYEIGIRK